MHACASVVWRPNTTTVRTISLRAQLHLKPQKKECSTPGLKRMAQRDDLPTLDVTSRGTKFVDNEGRTLTLRGVNLGGAKLPAGYRSDESEAAGDDASYVGRPFPLSEAAEHLGRLRAWGFNIVRLSVTWDALEHNERALRRARAAGLRAALLPAASRCVEINRCVT